MNLPSSKNNRGHNYRRRKSSNKTPENPYYNLSSTPSENLTVFINAVKNSFINLWSWKAPVTNKFAEAERLAPNSLKNREDVFIQQAHKDKKML